MYHVYIIAVSFLTFTNSLTLMQVSYQPLPYRVTHIMAYENVCTKDPNHHVTLF